MSSWGTPALVLVFAAAGVATWIAGIYLSKATDVLDGRFGLGDALGGMLLLGLAGSRDCDARLVLLVYLAAVFLLPAIPG